MAKNKKKKNADFQKVKLKPGRILKKSTNDFSNVNFKSKKILLEEQFQKFRQLGHDTLGNLFVLKELKHSNYRVRRTALSKIEGLLGRGELTQCCDTVIVEVLSLLSDPNNEIRDRALVLVKLLLQSMSSIEVKGCINIIETYACLTMTQVDNEIRHDSLKFFDLLLDMFPDLVSTSGKLISQFWELVSTKQKPGSPRILRIIPLSEKITAHKWKISVLQRIMKVLDANITRLQKLDESIKVEFPCLVETTSFHIIVNKKNPRIASLDMGDVIQTSDFSQNNLDNFLCELIEVLLESFKEASSNLHSKSSYCFEASSTKNVEECVIIIIKCLYMCAIWIDLLEQSKSQNKMSPNLKRSIYKPIQGLFSSFPVMSDKIRVITQEYYVRENNMYIMMNMELCNIFSLLVLDNEGCSSILTKRVLEFLQDHVRNRDPNILEQMFKILKHFLLCRTVDNDTCEPHLDAILENSKFESPFSQYRQLVSNFFLDLSIDDNFRELRKSQAVKTWLNQLPKEFLAVARNNIIDEEYVRKVIKIEVSALPTFLEGLQEASSEYIDLLRSENKYIQSAAVIFVSNIQTLRDSHFFLLFGISKDISVSPTVLKKLITRLNDRFEHSKSPGFSSLSFKSFLLNLTIGIYMNTEDPSLKDDLQMFYAMCQAVPAGLSAYKIVPSRHRQRQKELADFALGLLSRMPLKYNVASSAQTLLIELTRNIECMPVFAAISALRLFSTFVKDCPPVNENSHKLCTSVANLTLGIYLYEYVLSKMRLTEEDLETHSVKKELHQLSFNFGEIIGVMLSNLEHIGYIENTVFYGSILCELKNCCILASEDASSLTSLVQGLRTVYGKDIFSQEWYIKLESSQQ